MKRPIVVFSLGVLLGLGAGAGIMLVAFPFLFPPPQVNETVTGAAGGEPGNLIGSTRFREGVSGQDRVHWGRGGVRFYRARDGDVLMEFQDDFEVGPGPNYWIYLNTHGGIDDETAFHADLDSAKVTKLKSFTGSQVYALNANQFASAKAVTIWCETFNQYIASADVPGR